MSTNGIDYLAHAMELAQRNPTAMFCGLIELSSSDPRICALLDRKINSIASFHAETHDYVLLFIQGSQSDSGPLSRDIWIRCERHPDPKSLRAFLSITSPDASDSITLSFDKTRLTVPGHQLIGVAVRQKACFRHLVSLLSIISDVSRKYGLASANCWWFARVVFTTLDVYNGGQSMITPQSSLTKEVVKAMGRRMEVETKAVGDRFAAIYKDVTQSSGNNSDEDIRPVNFDLQLHPTSALPSPATSSTSSASSSSVQLSPFMDLLHAVRRPSMPERTLSPPKTSKSTPTSDVTTFHSLIDLVNFVMRRTEMDRMTLFVTFPAFTTPHDLLEAIDSNLHKSSDDVSDATSGAWYGNEEIWTEQRRDGVVKFVKQWLAYKEVAPPVANRLGALVVQNGGWASPDCSDVETSKRPVPRNQFDIPLSEMLKSDLKVLAQELRAREVDARLNLTTYPARIVTVLTSREPHLVAMDVFPNSACIYNWVQNSLINMKPVEGSSVYTRAKTYQAFVRLAQYCYEDKNYASAYDIVKALRSPNIFQLSSMSAAARDWDLESLLDKLWTDLNQNAHPDFNLAARATAAAGAAMAPVTDAISAAVTARLAEKDRKKAEDRAKRAKRANTGLWEVSGPAIPLALAWRTLKGGARTKAEEREEQAAKRAKATAEAAEAIIKAAQKATDAFIKTLALYHFALEYDRLRALMLSCTATDGSVDWLSLQDLSRQVIILANAELSNTIQYTSFRQFLDQSVSVDPDQIEEFEIRSQLVEREDAASLRSEPSRNP